MQKCRKYYFYFSAFVEDGRNEKRLRAVAVFLVKGDLW